MLIALFKRLGVEVNMRPVNSMARCPTKLRHGVSGTLDIRTASLFLLIPVDDAGRNPAAICDPVAREALASFEQPDSHVCCSSRNHGVQPGQAQRNNGVYMTQSGSCVLKATTFGHVHIRVSLLCSQPRSIKCQSSRCLKAPSASRRKY